MFRLNVSVSRINILCPPLKCTLILFDTGELKLLDTEGLKMLGARAEFVRHEV